MLRGAVKRTFEYTVEKIPESSKRKAKGGNSDFVGLFSVLLIVFSPISPEMPPDESEIRTGGLIALDHTLLPNPLELYGLNVRNVEIETVLFIFTMFGCVLCCLLFSVCGRLYDYWSNQQAINDGHRERISCFIHRLGELFEKRNILHCCPSHAHIPVILFDNIGNI